MYFAILPHKPPHVTSQPPTKSPTVNTSTRTSFVNADLAHASTAKTPLLRSYGLVMPATTSQTSPSQWEENPDLHCQAIAAEYQRAIEHDTAQVPITPQLCTDARNWLHAELATITRLGFWPLFTDEESLLPDTIAAFNQPCVDGETTAVPITSLHNEDKHPIWTPLENLLFRFVHDFHHWAINADATFTGELAVTRCVLTPAVRKNDALSRLLASEIVGQAAVTIVFGSFPEQIIACNILELI
jgi:hypothetical protein